jgi:hypothetical protein
MKKNKFKIVFIIIVILLLLIGVFLIPNKNKLSYDDNILLKIGSFKVTESEFNNFHNSYFKNSGNSGVENSIMYFIKTGLIIQEAQRLKIDSDKEFYRCVHLNMKQSVIEKYRNYKIQEQKISIKDIKNSYEYGKYKLIADYVQIRQSQKNYVGLIERLMKGGASIQEIYNNSALQDIANDNDNIFFFEDIEILCGFFSNDVERKIFKLNTGDIAIVKTPAYSYIFRIINKVKNKQDSFIYESDIIRKRIAISRLSESQDLAFCNTIGKKIIIADFLNSINLSVSPLKNNGSIDNNIIATYNKTQIDVNYLINKIKSLPEYVQDYFQNKYTRSDAIISLIILDKDNLLNNGIPKSDYFFSQQLDRTNESQNVFNSQNFLIDTLKLEKVINEINKISSHSSHQKRLIKAPSLSLLKNFKTGYRFNYPWLSPEIFPNLDSIELNFYNLSFLDSFQFKQNFYNEIIATKGKWKLTVKDFFKELEILSPRTIIELVKIDNSVKLINYLANKQNDSNGKTYINYELLQRLNVTAFIKEKFYFPEEDDIVATLNEQQISVHDLRMLIAELPFEKKQEILDNNTRVLETTRLLKDFFIYNYITKTDFYKKIDSVEFSKRIEDVMLAQRFLGLLKDNNSPNDASKLNEIQYQFAFKKVVNKKLDDYLELLLSNGKIELNLKLCKKLNISSEKIKKNYKLNVTDLIL